MHPKTRGVLAVLGLLLGLGAAWAQQRLCDPTDVRFSVITRDGKLVRGLTVEALTAKVKKRQASIESLSTDTGPRRLLFILYTGKAYKSELSSEVEAVRSIVSSARLEDGFALLTAIGPSREVQFGASREAVISAAQQLLDRSKKKSSRDGNILDVILRGVRWFGEPQPGDSILVLSPDLPWGEPYSYGYGRLREALTKRRIRLFSIELAHHDWRYWYGGLNWESQGYRFGWDYRFGATPLEWLSQNSGGDDSWGSCAERIDCQRTEVIEQIRDKASQFYSAVVETYVARVRFPSLRTPQHWDLDLAEEMRQRVPTAKLIYPRWTVPCAPSRAAK